MRRVVMLLVMSALLLGILSGCSRSDDESSVKEELFVLREAKDSLGHFALATDGADIYIVNLHTNSTYLARKLMTSVRAALSRELPEVDFGIEFETLEEHSPNTRKSSLEEAVGVYNSFIDSGWKEITMYSNNDYVDYFFQKGNKFSRLIILRDRVKVFREVEGNFIDSWTYISG